MTIPAPRSSSTRSERSWMETATPAARSSIRSLIRQENLQQSTLSSHFPRHQRLPEGMKCDAHGLRFDDVRQIHCASESLFRSGKRGDGFASARHHSCVLTTSKRAFDEKEHPRQNAGKPNDFGTLISCHLCAQNLRFGSTSRNQNETAFRRATAKIRRRCD